MSDVSEEWLELCRSANEEEIIANRECLENAGIEVTRGVAGPVTGNLGSAYGAWNDDPTEGIIRVKRSDFKSAREALQDGLLATPLPEGHYLTEFSNDELADLLINQNSWSAFDVAHAKRLAREQNLDLANLASESEKLAKTRKEGKPASKWHLMLGWTCAILGGFIGFGIGWSLVYMEDKTPECNYPTYDERSREIGKSMMTVGFIMFILWTFTDFFPKLFDIGG